MSNLLQIVLVIQACILGNNRSYFFMESIVSLFSACIARKILADSIREQYAMGVGLSLIKGLHHLPNIGGSPGHPVEHPVERFKLVVGGCLAIQNRLILRPEIPFEHGNSLDFTGLSVLHLEIGKRILLYFFKIQNTCK